MQSRVNMTEKISRLVKAIARSRSSVTDVTAPRGTLPFVTITRAAGAGGSTVAHALAGALNVREPDAGWQAYDRELVEIVAKDHEISEPLVQALEEKSRNWINRLLVSGSASDFGVYQRVATTIRALAEEGGAILVGRGAVFITRDLPRGVHIRLVAPEEHRIRHLMQSRGWTEERAAEYVRETDLGRAKFYRSRWPDKSLDAETFHATFNTALVGPGDLVRALTEMIPWMEATDG